MQLAEAATRKGRARDVMHEQHLFVLHARPSAYTKPCRITSHWHHRHLNRTNASSTFRRSSQWGPLLFSDLLGDLSRLHSILIATRPMKKWMHEELRNLSAYFLVDQTDTRGHQRPTVGPLIKDPWFCGKWAHDI